MQGGSGTSNENNAQNGNSGGSGNENNAQNGNSGGSGNENQATENGNSGSNESIYNLFKMFNGTNALFKEQQDDSNFYAFKQ